MASKHLVDPDLLPIVEQAPPLEPTTESLPELRSVISELRAPAPPASEVTVEERAVPGPGGSTVRVLVYSPKTPTRTGGLLWFHAGGMVMGTPDMYEPQSRFLAQQAGCVVIAVDYGLAPENPYPAALEDCYAALRWAHAAADELRIPRRRPGGGTCAAGTRSRRAGRLRPVSRVPHARRPDRHFRRAGTDALRGRVRLDASQQ